MLIGEGVYWMVVGRLREMSRLGNVVIGRPIKSEVRMDSLREKGICDCSGCIGRGEYFRRF